ncbi:hypothetical protein [Dorea longicatena]|uniref:hypothetical protein n=1 Tax=Dorea longicatena TaxID=88431 RepID=UPI0022E8AB8C|nr:hypothetical protein [Dorea longicatena]
MYQTSQEYKESMKRPVRNQSYMKIQLGLINQEAQQTAGLSDTNKYNDFSDAESIFNQHTVRRYATYESNFWKANGISFFLPEKKSDYRKDGITSTDLFEESFHVKFVFGCGKSDIKGLTIKFGRNYPTKFTIVTDNATSFEYENTEELFKSDDVFENTESIELVITEMNVPNARVRIDYIIFGLGLEYDDEWISEASSNTTLSAINEDLPESEFKVTLCNDNQLFNVDNPSSDINFLESGQKVNVMMGYMLDDGNIEWIKMHSLYVSEWSANDSSATITAVDILKYLDEKYYKGIYYEDGISLYDLAVLVLTDAGLNEDEYCIDSYMKKVYVHNPLPNVTHKEALQIIANAGRCIMDYDRNGKIRIRVAFKPTYDTTSNGETYFSNAPTIDNLTEKNQYATCEQNFWKADGKKLFVPTDHHQDTGYISASISDENGKFDANPMLTRTLEAKYKAYGIMINFSGNLPKKIVIRTYADDVLNNTLTITSGIEQATEINYDFPEYDRLEIEFPETEPNSRIHIDYLSLGAETSYSLEYDDLYSTPIGTQLEKIKNVKVSRSLYSKSATKEDLTSETITYSGENQIYYLNDPCYGYSVAISNAKSGQSAKIVSSGAYYVEVAFSGVKTGENIEVAITGYKYNVATSYYSQPVHNRGTEKEWKNPLISFDDHCQEVAKWLADYFASGIEYELDYRGEPAIDCGDVIGQENKYDPDLKTIVEQSQITFKSGLLGGGLRTRRKEYVARTKNRLVS